MLATIVIAVLSSSVISSLVAAVLKGRFDERLARLNAEISREHRLLEEQIAADASYRSAHLAALQQVITAASTEEALVQLRDAQQLRDARRRMYPELESCSYRLLRLLKDVIEGRTQAHLAIASQNELLLMVQNLLFDLRLDLEADGVFLPLHRFKNALRAACAVSEEAAQSTHPEVKARLMADLKSLVQDVNAQHEQIVPTLADLVRRLPSSAEGFSLAESAAAKELPSTLDARD